MPSKKAMELARNTFGHEAMLDSFEGERLTKLATHIDEAVKPLVATLMVARQGMDRDQDGLWERITRVLEGWQ